MPVTNFSKLCQRFLHQRFPISKMLMRQTQRPFATVELREKEKNIFSKNQLKFFEDLKSQEISSTLQSAGWSDDRKKLANFLLNRFNSKMDLSFIEEEKIRYLNTIIADASYAGRVRERLFADLVHILNFSCEELNKIVRVHSYRDWDFFHDLFPLIEKCENRNALLDIVLLLQMEAEALQRSIHLSWDHYHSQEASFLHSAMYKRGTFCVSEPKYFVSHVPDLFKFLIENHLMEDLLKCKNLSKVFKLSFILIHEGMPDCIKKVINDEKEVHNLLECIEKEGANFHYHRILINNSDIVGKIELLVKKYYNLNYKKFNLTNEILDKFVRAVRMLTNDKLWDITITLLEKGKIDLGFIIENLELVPIAVDLIILKASESTKDNLRPYLYHHPLLAKKIISSCAIVSNNFLLPLSRDEIQNITKNIQQKEMLSFSGHAAFFSSCVVFFTGAAVYQMKLKDTPETAMQSSPTYSSSMCGFVP